MASNFRAPRSDEERCPATTEIMVGDPVGYVAAVRCQLLRHHDDPDYAREAIEPWHEWVTSDRDTGAHGGGWGRDQTVRVTWQTTPRPTRRGM